MSRQTVGSSVAESQREDYVRRDGRAQSAPDEAVTLLHVSQSNVMVLDLVVKGQDALDVCRLIESRFEMSNLQIARLISREESSRPEALMRSEAQGDENRSARPDLSMVRLSAVVKSKNAVPAVRACSTGRSAVIVHPGRREVSVNGRLVPLTCTEFGILSCLATKPGWVFTRDQILDAARGEDNNTLDCSVNGHIASLRKKLGQAAALIETVRGVGYRLKDVQG